MGQRRDNQGRFARRLFAPAAPTAAAPTAARVGAKPAAKKTPAVKLKYDPRVDVERLERALDPSLGWFARRALRKELESQFGKIDWTATAAVDEPVDVETDASGAQADHKTDRLPGATEDTLRAFSGLTGTLWVRIAETGPEQFRKIAEQARVELRDAGDPDASADEVFAGVTHAVVFYGPIQDRFLPDDILFYPNRIAQ